MEIIHNTRNQIAMMTAAAAMGGGLAANSAYASEAPHTGETSVTVTDPSTDPASATHEEICNGSSNGKGDPIVEVYEPNSAGESMKGSYPDGDTGLDDPRTDEDMYFVFEDCYGISNQICEGMGGIVVRSTAEEEAAEDRRTYTCVGEETPTPTDPGDPDFDPIRGPFDGSIYDMPGGYEKGGSYPYDDMYPDGPGYEEGAGPESDDSYRYSPGFIAKCVTRALSNPLARVRYVSRKSKELLVERKAIRQHKGCEEVISTKTKVTPLLEVARPAAKGSGTTLSPNGKSVPMVEGDTDRIVKSRQAYTCEGSKTDKAVRDYGVRISETVTIEESGETISRTFTFRGDRYEAKNGKVAPVVC